MPAQPELQLPPWLDRNWPSISKVPISSQRCLGESNSNFLGSAVYYNSIANYDGNILSITLDNDPAVQVTAVAPSLEYQCQLLFSKTNLDTTVQHTLNIQLVGLSPETQPGVDGKLPSPMLALDYFVFVPTHSENFI